VDFFFASLNLRAFRGELTALMPKRAPNESHRRQTSQILHAVQHFIIPIYSAPTPDPVRKEQLWSRHPPDWCFLGDCVHLYRSVVHIDERPPQRSPCGRPVGDRWPAAADQHRPCCSPPSAECSRSCQKSQQEPLKGFAPDMVASTTLINRLPKGATSVSTAAIPITDRTTP